MSENEERSPAVANATAKTGARTPRGSEETAHPKAERRIWAAGLLVEALLLGWAFAKGFFAKAPAHERTAPPFGDQAPDTVKDQAPVDTTLARAPKTDRTADRNLDLERGSNILIRERWGTLFVVCSFVLGIAAGVSFLFMYWSGVGNLLLGGTLALFLAGFGLALVLYSHWLILQKEATEPRENLSSNRSERDDALEDYCAGVQDIKRRRLLKWMGAAGTGILGAMVISLMRSLGMSPYPALFNTVWKRGQRLMTPEGKPVSVDSLQPGSAITVFPENSIGSERAQTVLIRVKEQLLQLPKDRASWAPMGYVAYSRVCTHAGCSVGLFESGTNLLLCPCHQSTFDVLRAAQPTGGPAARPLPQLPLYADGDGTLRAAEGFTAPPGPGFWGLS